MGAQYVMRAALRLDPGLKNLVDHYLKEFDRRPAAIASYSMGRFAGGNSHADWTVTLSAMGMAVMPERLSVGQIGQVLDEQARPQGEGGAALDRGFAGFADTLIWWALAAKAQR